jgi:hypothetical protein
MLRRNSSLRAGLKSLQRKVDEIFEGDNGASAPPLSTRSRVVMSA